MLHKILSEYLSMIESSVRQLENAHTERYEEEIISSDRINLRIRIRFLNGYLLEINEAVIVEAGKAEYPGYRYHFQDADNKLVFRYDDTPHFPDIKTYPHHKHLQEDVLSAEKPFLTDVIRETVMYLSIHE